HNRLPSGRPGRTCTLDETSGCAAWPAQSHGVARDDRRPAVAGGCRLRHHRAHRPIAYGHAATTADPAGSISLDCGGRRAAARSPARRPMGTDIPALAAAAAGCRLRHAQLVYINPSEFAFPPQPDAGPDHATSALYITAQPPDHPP